MFVIKFHFRSEVRRIAVSEALPFYQLVQLAKELFNRLPSELAFQYTDDEGDVITVTSEKESQEAFRVAQTSQPSILNFTIVPYSYQTESQQRQAFPWNRCGYQPRSFGGLRIFVQPESNSAPRFVHPAICDHCNERIVGYRFKCTACDDFDLCESCYDEGTHEESHVFLKIHPSAYFRRPWWSSPCGSSSGSCQPRWGNCCQNNENDEEENEENEDEGCQCTEDDDCKCSDDEETCQCKGKDDKEESPKNDEQKEDQPSKDSFEAKPANEEATQPTVVPSESAPSTAPESKKEVAPAETSDPQPTQETKVESPKIPTSPFQRKLKDLHDMGFQNRDQNIELLLKHNGDLVKVVQSLLDASY